tara:strand:- start:735 stop:989 length:255 start_codon:yes stop_codon:yes gene_type:complete
LAEQLQAIHYIFEHIEVVGFGGFDDAVEDGACIGSGCGLAEQPVFSAYDERLDCSLCTVVIDTGLSSSCLDLSITGHKQIKVVA